MDNGEQLRSMFSPPPAATTAALVAPRITNRSPFRSSPGHPRRPSPVKQVSIDAFIGSKATKVKEDVQFKVPFLPLTAPQQATPAAFNDDVPLYPHQERSLYRMLQLEAHDDQVCKFNFGMLDYYSKGGCLADAIGTGKTATMLALIVSEPINATLGGNLLVAPSHLLAQWKAEVTKFVKPGEIDVVVGLRRYLAMDSDEISNRTLVLVGVEEAIASQAHYYHFRKIYPREVGKAGRPMSVDLDALHEYGEAAKYVSKAYSGPVWVTALHLPAKPWRRVVFEEVQDLVLPGKESQDCFIQLTRKSEHVWLITATPFPAKAESIYANNQLLGFKRLRLLAHDRAFDEIKRKLYLRNCAQVKQDAITNKIRLKETYISVRLHPRELLLVKIEQVLAASQAASATFHLADDGSTEEQQPHKTRGRKPAAAAAAALATSATSSSSTSSSTSSSSSIYWSEQYNCARQSCVHVGISDRVLDRDSAGGRRSNQSQQLQANGLPVAVKVKTPNDVYKHEKYFLDRQLAVAKMRQTDVDALEKATRNTVAILQTILGNVYWDVRECFADMKTSGLDAFFEGYSMETELGFRMLSKHGQWVNMCPPEPMDLIMFHQDEIEGYLCKFHDSKPALARLCQVMETTLNERCPRARALVSDELTQIAECIALKNQLETQEQEQTREHESDTVAANKIPTHGSKITHLILYLQRLSASPRPSQVVVFTMWTNALRVVEQALRASGISCAVFLQHQSSETKSAHVQAFVNGDVQVLLLNSLTSASGINLQVASHVVFLDPVGFSATQASTLEQQAIGRVLRMGQTHAQVTVVRLVAEQTIEATLFDDIHAVTTRVAAADDSFFDGTKPATGRSGDGDDGDDDENGAYVCLAFADPIRSVVRMEVRPEQRRRQALASAEDDHADEQEIAMVGAMSLEEIINRRVESAAAQGEVFDLTDDADASLDVQIAAAKRAHGEQEDEDDGLVVPVGDAQERKRQRTQRLQQQLQRMSGQTFQGEIAIENDRVVLVKSERAN